MRNLAKDIKQTTVGVLFLSFLFSGWAADGATVPHCPSDDNAIITLDAGKGVTIGGSRPRGEVVIVALQYQRGQNQQWQWDGSPFQFWDARSCPGNPNCNDPDPKAYPVQTAHAFDLVPGNGILSIKVYARERDEKTHPGLDFFVSDILHGSEHDGTPSLGIVALPGQEVDTTLWFCPTGSKCSFFPH
jgi:hypothetical protein